MSESAEYKAFKDCHSSLLTCIKQSPKDVCDHLLPFEILAPNDRDYLKNDHHDDGDKARRILDAVLLQIKNDPQVFHSFVSALEAAGRFTKAGVQELNHALQRRNQEQCDQTQRIEDNSYENSPMSLLQPLPGLAVTEEAGSVFELPTMDDGDGGTLPDPLEHPPDDAEVGADLRAAATSRQVAPTADSFGGQLLQTFQSEEIEQVIELLSQAESQSIDLIGVSDADGKTLLHLACRKNWMDWHGIVGSLVENHHCDVAAVDEDGNTPFHEVYQCGNLPSVEYLLSLPSCNPDAINKQEYTVLRMALEKNDKKTVAQLLATGRVDPRKGSSCGHTYSELLAMNQLQPQPQDYDGSALQMVIQFAECMEGNNHVRQPFTSYCLHKMLHKILKNRDQVTITRIVDRIKENMLPLPEEPDKIHNLIIDIQSLSDEFDIRGEPTNVVDIQIRKKGGREIFQRDIQQESINTTQNVTVPADVEDQETSDYPNASEESMGNTLGLQNFVILADNEDLEIPDYHSNASSNKLPFLPTSRTEVQNTTQNYETNECYQITLGACFCSCCCCFIVSLILGICGAVLYDRYLLVGTTNAVQIHRQSVPLIAIQDPSTNFVRLSEISGTDLVTIIFYKLSDCSSSAAFIDVEFNEMVNVSFSSPTIKSKPVTELYLAGNTTLTVNITTNMPSTNSCFIALVVFDDFTNYLNFISSSSLDNYYFMDCITNETSQTKILMFYRPSYYYIGVYTDFPTEATTFSLHLVGTYLQYDTSEGTPVCFISSLEDLSCEFSPSTNQEFCIVGFVPPANQQFGIRGTTVEYYTADNSDTAINTFFFIPLICSVFWCCLLLCFISCTMYRPDQRQ